MNLHSKLIGVAVTGLLGVGCGSDSAVTKDGVEASTANNSLPNNSLPNNSLPNNSLANNSLPNNSLANNSLPNNSLPNNGFANSTDSGKFNTWLAADSFRPMLMKYLVSCALPAGKTITVGTNSWPGELGLAANWATGPLTDVNDQERVSACVLARVNNFGQPVQISLRGKVTPPAGSATTGTFTGLTAGTDSITGKAETTAFPYWEGSVWGNLFLPTPEIHSCAGVDFWAAHGIGRECMNPTQGCDNWNVRNTGVGADYPNAGLTYFKQNHVAHFCYNVAGNGIGTAPGSGVTNAYPIGYPTAAQNSNATQNGKGDCSVFSAPNTASSASTMPTGGYSVTCSDGTYTNSNVISVYDRAETIVTRSVKGSGATASYYYSIVPQDAQAAGYTVQHQPYFWLNAGNVTAANVASINFVFRCMPTSGHQYLALSATIVNSANGASGACGSDSEEGQLGVINLASGSNTEPLYHWSSPTKGHYYSLDSTGADKATSSDWTYVGVFGYVLKS